MAARRGLAACRDGVRGVGFPELLVPKCRPFDAEVFRFVSCVISETSLSVSCNVSHSVPPA